MTPFPDMILEPLVRAALLEDLGHEVHALTTFEGA